IAYRVGARPQQHAGENVLRLQRARIVSPHFTLLVGSTDVDVIAARAGGHVEDCVTTWVHDESLLAGLLAATIVLGRWRGGEFREIYEQLRHRAGWVDRDIECRLQ